MRADTPDNENISDGKEFVDNQSLPSSELLSRRLSIAWSLCPQENDEVPQTVA